MIKLRWVAELLRKNPTPFTFLIFVVVVLVFVLGSTHLSEMNQSVVVWGLVLLLLPATVLVVISLVRGSLPPLTPREQLIMNKHIALESGLIPACANHYIGQPIRISQAALLALYNRLLA